MFKFSHYIERFKVSHELANGYGIFFTFDPFFEGFSLVTV